MSDGIERARVLIKLYDIQQLTIEDRSNKFKWRIDASGKIEEYPRFPHKPIRLHFGKLIFYSRGQHKYRYKKTLCFKDGETLVKAIKKMIAAENPLD